MADIILEMKSITKEFPGVKALDNVNLKVEAGEIETHVLLGLNPGLINASGYSWTADYVTVTGDLDEGARETLTRQIQEDFAIPVERQVYRERDQYESGDGA